MNEEDERVKRNMAQTQAALGVAPSSDTFRWPWPGKALNGRTMGKMGKPNRPAQRSGRGRVRKNYPSYGND